MRAAVCEQVQQENTAPGHGLTNMKMAETKGELRGSKTGNV